MKTLYIKQTKPQKYLYILMGAIFIFQGIVGLMKDVTEISFWFGFPQLGFGIFCGLYAFSIIKPSSINSPRIFLGEEDITLHLGLPLKKPKTIAHSDIKLIQLKPEQLSVITKEYDFTHSISYEAPNKEETMSELADYAKEKNLPVERLSYRNV
ncbi:hypothetical protein [Ekhidna sp.]